MASVAIRSVDGAESLRIERVDYEDFVNYSVEASLAGHTLANDAVVFQNTPAFLEALATFEQTRRGLAELEGTEECRLSIEADGGTGDAWLSLQISRILTFHSPKTSHSRSGHITLAGGFSVSGEVIADTLRDFRGLFRSS